MFKITNALRHGTRRWRWKVVNEDGKAVCLSPTSYGSEEDAYRSWLQAKELIRQDTNRRRRFLWWDITRAK